MSFLVTGFAAMLVSAPALVSGFGLGTLLLPALALFFPVKVAVAATAAAHGANNAFTITLVEVHAEKALVLRFGLPAFAGAAALGCVAHVGEIFRYPGTTSRRRVHFSPAMAVVTPVKLVMEC